MTLRMRSQCCQRPKAHEDLEMGPVRRRETSETRPNPWARYPAPRIHAHVRRLVPSRVGVGREEALNHLCWRGVGGDQRR